MFKEEQTWLITMLDLVLLMVCFYVLNYSLTIANVSTKSHFEPSIIEADILVKRAVAATPIHIIYNNLTTGHYNHPAAVEFMNSENIIRIIPAFKSFEKKLIIVEAERLSSHLYNYSKNLIKVQLLINYPELHEEAIKKEEDVKQVLKKLIEQASNFRNLLAKNTNNAKIITTVDLHSNYAVLKNKKWIVVVDIFGEPN